MKVELYLVRYDETGKELVQPSEWIDTTGRIVGGWADATAEPIGTYLDADAENANYHDRVGLGMALARVIGRYAGPAAARDVLSEFAELGGWREAAELGWGER